MRNERNCKTCLYTRYTDEELRSVGLVTVADVDVVSPMVSGSDDHKCHENQSRICRGLRARVAEMQA